ncbi:hypothetical protein, partial [Priestia megaterium]|uniref:hypothetical protein n=1 Tax=Priestia megaterium TaxID=1404 RepID=UPI002FFFABD2
MKGRYKKSLSQGGIEAPKLKSHLKMKKRRPTSTEINKIRSKHLSKLPRMLSTSAIQDITEDLETTPVPLRRLSPNIVRNRLRLSNLKEFKGVQKDKPTPTTITPVNINQILVRFKNQYESLQKFEKIEIDTLELIDGEKFFSFVANGD